MVNRHSTGYFEIWIDGSIVRTLAVLSGEMETRLHSPTTRREHLSLLKIRDFIGELVPTLVKGGKISIIPFATVSKPGSSRVRGIR